MRNTESCLFSTTVVRVLTAVARTNSAERSDRAARTNTARTSARAGCRIASHHTVTGTPYNNSTIHAQYLPGLLSPINDSTRLDGLMD
mmetsp:Transcript_14058/g.28952  ORF Transcript_14058/g.28952 Transcript_14058/m.28952 type:complete len:88 (+) Transcript_14058:100-363(+)